MVAEKERPFRLPGEMLDGCTPWPEEFARRYRAEGYWQDITLGEMLHRSMLRHPDKLALVDGEKSATYGELVERSHRLAVQFARLGLKPRERVIFQLSNSIELVYAFFALLHIGAIPVMALPAHRRTELVHFARHAQAVAHLIPASTDRFDHAALAEELRREVPSIRMVVTAGTPAPGQVALEALLADDADDDALSRTRVDAFGDASDVALMMLSGGTTALSKFIPRTHNDYVYNCTQSGAVAGFGERTVFLAVLPMSHGYTLSSPGLLAVLSHGGTVVIAPDPRPETVFPLIERHRITVVAGGVPLAVSWLASPWPERCDLSSLQVYMNGGARLLPELRRQIEQRFGCTYVESYGAGEGLLNQTRLDDPEEIRFHSSGRPVSPADEIKVLDPHGNELPDGVVGELAARGPYTVRGYYKAPEATAAAFTPDGFYRMGDAVRKVGDYLYLEGRLKDLINRGGEKVSVEEVENHVIAHPSVANVCVVAMPDERYGEKACAFVVTKPNCTLSFEQLQEFLLARGIAKFKLPERLEVVDAFPLSPAGKVLRRELRAIIATRLEAERVERIGAAPGPANDNYGDIG
ncbi:MAG: AMP-binding protein [Burkholderiaceae bacterium]|nr:AMP-binding protein [Burkholderiaceae bacterium]